MARVLTKYEHWDELLDPKTILWRDIFLDKINKLLGIDSYVIDAQQVKELCPQINISREGVTGAQESVARSLPEKIAELRSASTLPIAVGFGISNPDQAREVAKQADAIVVGSAIVDLIAKQGDKPAMIETVGAFARELANAVH